LVSSKIQPMPAKNMFLSRFWKPYQSQVAT